MKKAKLVSVKVDIENLPPLTAAQTAELDDLSRQPDSTIDFSDIAPLTDDELSQAGRGPNFRALKRQTTLRIDADILDWFKRRAEANNGGRGYQTDINKALRDYVEAQEKAAKAG